MFKPLLGPVIGVFVQGIPGSIGSSGPERFGIPGMPAWHLSRAARENAGGPRSRKGIQGSIARLLCASSDMLLRLVEIVRAHNKTVC